MILKILLVIGVIAIIYYMFIKKKPLTKEKSRSKKDATYANDMVACAHCELYVDIDEAILSNGKYYCSQECLKEDK